MARLDETPSAIDPLDEAYSHTSSPVDVSPQNAGGLSSGFDADCRDIRQHDDGLFGVRRCEPRRQGAEPGDVYLLSDEAMPSLTRSLRTDLSGLSDGAPSKPEPTRFNDPSRFTLRNLLLVITLASVVMGIGVRFPRPVFAGAAGLAALVTAVSASWLRSGGAVLQLAWWTLLGIYLMACGFALLGL